MGRTGTDSQLLTTASMRICRAACCLVSALLLLTSCGGGGGGSATPTQSSGQRCPAPPRPSTIDTASGTELSRSLGLGLINANAAYGSSITGNGVTLGQIDTGVYWSGSGGAARTHSELQGQVVTSSASAQARVNGVLPSASSVRHGLATAGIMVARRDGAGVHGVAPGARLQTLTLGLGSAGSVYSPLTLGNFLDRDAGLISHFTGSNVLAVNNSWGYQGLISGYQEAGIRAVMPNFISALAQAGAMPADRKIFVWAAGNSNAQNYADGTPVNANVPHLLPGLPLRIAELRGHSLAVVSVDNSGDISCFSNHCGGASDFCLAAPGEVTGGALRLYTDAASPDGATEYYNAGRGTSFAAPVVTGALALLKERFPTMGNHELVSRLLATATKTGRYADRNIYGQGLLNVSAGLTMAVGPISIHLGRSLSDGAAYSFRSSSMHLSSPLAALHASSSAHEIEAYDTLGTPFKHALRSFLSSEGGSDDALQRLLAARTLDERLLRHGEGSYAVGYSGVDMNGNHAYGSRLWFRLGDNGFWFGSGPGARSHHAEPMFSGIHGFSSPFTGMAEGGFALGMEGKAFADSVWQLESYVPGTHHSSLDSVNTLGLVASLSSFAGDSPWRFSAGMLREGDSILSSVGTGAFGDINATTWHGGVDLAHHFGAWSGYASGHFGMTSGSSSSGLWRGVESVRSSSWALGLVRRGVFSGDDAVGVRVVQTLRAEGGRARFLLPDSRDRYGNLYSRGVSLSAEPDGREMDFALSWQRALPGSGSFSMDFGVTTEPGHVAGGSSRMWGGVAWLQRF